MAGGGWYGRWPEVVGGSLSNQKGNAGSAGSLGTGGTGGASYSQGARAYYGSGRWCPEAVVQALYVQQHQDQVVATM